MNQQSPDYDPWEATPLADIDDDDAAGCFGWLGAVLCCVIVWVAGILAIVLTR